MCFGDAYEIPDDVRQGPHSPAFAQFLRHWFVDSVGLIRGEVALPFLSDLTSREKEVAKDLLRRNAVLGYTHIIEGIAALEDIAAVPLLRTMLAKETDLSRQLTIAGTLWKLTQDPSFVECLKHMLASTKATLKQAHFHQILWLGDERTIDFLIDMLDDKDKFVRFLAVSELNRLEFGSNFFVLENLLPHRASYYQKNRQDRNLRQILVRTLMAVNK